MVWMDKTQLRLGMRQVGALSFSSFLLRNEQSVLGILWYLLDPTVLFLIIFSIFSAREGAHIAHYAVYLFSGLIVYNFFSTVIAEAPGLMRGYRHLLIGMHLPIPILSLSLILRQLYAHIFEIALLAVVMFISDISLFGIICYLPILVLLSCFLTAGVYILSVAGALIADTANIIRFALQMIFIGTPIFYADIIPRFVALLNPFYPFLILSRAALFNESFSSTMLVHAVALTLVTILFAGVCYSLWNSRAIEYV